MNEIHQCNIFEHLRERLYVTPSFFYIFVVLLVLYNWETQLWTDCFIFIVLKRIGNKSFRESVESYNVIEFLVYLLRVRDFAENFFCVCMFCYQYASFLLIETLCFSVFYNRLFQCHYFFCVSKPFWLMAC